MTNGIILLGKRGAGKTTIAKNISYDGDWTHLELSKFANERMLLSENKFSSLREYVLELAKMYSPSYLVEQAFIESSLSNSETKHIVTGIRTVAHLNAFLKVRPNTLVVYLNPSIFLRYIRTRKRANRNDIRGFIEEEYYSHLWGDHALKAKAHLSFSNGSVDSISTKILLELSSST